MFDLTRLDLSDLDRSLLHHLLNVGEHLHVERKRELPSAEALSELLGSMGNTEGGWAILGVEDDGTVVGLLPSRTDLQDEVRDRVKGKLDPLPNFAARRANFNGVEVGIIRVYRSDDTPLVCTHKGAIYIRLPGGKEPISSRRQLDALVARGSESSGDDAGALDRLQSSEVVAEALSAPELTGARVYEEPANREWVLRVTPLRLSSDFGSRVRTAAVKEASEAVALRLLPPAPNQLGGDEWAEQQAVSPGWITWGQRVGERGAGAVAIDPAGVVAIMARERSVRTVINVAPLVLDTIGPLITGALSVLAAAGVSGRFLCDLHARGFAGVVLQDGREHVYMSPGTRSSQSHEIGSSAGTDDRLAVARRLAVDIANDAGLLLFSD